MTKKNSVPPPTGCSPRAWTLEAGEVRVWAIELLQSPATVARLRALLSPDEVARADRFHFEEHRARFTVARGALRSILAGYLGTGPSSVVFDYNAFGKPSLSPTDHGTDLRFNLSHSGDMALCACARARELGIDVEVMRTIANADSLAERYFDPAEAATYRMLAPDHRPEGFLVRWTLKEAYIKACGKGMSIPLSSFSIPAVPDSDGRHRVYSANSEDDRRWSAIRLTCWPGHVAALVVEGSTWHVGFSTWTPFE